VFAGAKKRMPEAISVTFPSSISCGSEGDPELTIY
jgi:hypothetical protein